jgi:hypothetical protein
VFIKNKTTLLKGFGMRGKTLTSGESKGRVSGNFNFRGRKGIVSGNLNFMGRKGIFAGPIC